MGDCARFIADCARFMGDCARFRRDCARFLGDCARFSLACGDVFKLFMQYLCTYRHLSIFRCSCGNIPREIWEVCNFVAICLGMACVSSLLFHKFTARVQLQDKPGPQPKRGIMACFIAVCACSLAAAAAAE